MEDYPVKMAPCPNCGADSENRTLREMATSRYVSIRSDAHKINGSPVQALVCKNCGYVQLFTNPQDFK